MSIYVIQTFEYIGKLGDIVLFVDFSINAMAEPFIKEKALKKWMEGVPEMVRDERYINREALSEEQIEKFANRSEKRIAESFRQKFYQSNKIVLNMSLVTMCTVLELFIEHIFLSIFDAKVETLLTLSKGKSITLEQLLKFNNYDEVLTNFKRKYIDHITRQGIREILKAFDAIGIDHNTLFSWSTFTSDVQSRFNGWNDERLIDIFNKRHSVVHQNELPISTLDELLLIKDFFTKLMLNLSLKTWHKFYKYGLILDVHQQMREAIKAAGGDPSSYPPPPKSE